MGVATAPRAPGRRALHLAKWDADPDDARQVILGFTPAGVGLLEDSIASARELEQGFAAALGRQELAHLERQSLKLYTELGLESEVFKGGLDVDSLATELLENLGQRNARLLAQRLLQATDN